MSTWHFALFHGKVFFVTDVFSAVSIPKDRIPFYWMPTDYICFAKKVVMVQRTLAYSNKMFSFSQKIFCNVLDLLLNEIKTVAQTQAGFFDFNTNIQITYNLSYLWCRIYHVFLVAMF